MLHRGATGWIAISSHELYRNAAGVTRALREWKIAKVTGLQSWAEPSGVGNWRILRSCCGGGGSSDLLDPYAGSG